MTRLSPREITQKGILPNTGYFHIKSDIMGAEYAVWVTVPMGYAPRKAGGYPLVMMPDGNLYGPFVGSLYRVMSIDLIFPIRPFISVAVGYTEAEADSQSFLRLRDLLPPGEPANPDMEEAMLKNAQSGLISAAEREAALNKLRDNRADDFLRFLTQELYPAIAETYNIDSSAPALFGYSYGGLFALYTALRGGGGFNKIGASSPGILTDDSIIFDELRAGAGNGRDYSGLELLTTVNEYELTMPSFYRSIGANLARLNDELRRVSLNGLTYKTEVLMGQTHVSGMSQAWFRFVREFFSGSDDRAG